MTNDIRAARAQGNWAEVERLQCELFSGIRVQQQLNYYEDLAWLDKSWLTRKFLTFTAWARTLFWRQ